MVDETQTPLPAKETVTPPSLPSEITAIVDLIDLIAKKLLPYSQVEQHVHDDVALLARLFDKLIS
jgi:hypothetical protein